MGKIFLVTATPYDPVGAAETAVYFSTGRPDGKAPVYNSLLWPARLTTAFNAEVTVFTGEFGGAVPTFGVVQIALVAGEYDALLGYYWDGRDISIYRGEETDAFGSMSLIFKGTVRSIQWDRFTLTLNLADYGEVVQKPVQTTLYAGTGAAEGGSDLTGKPKPLAFGGPRNVEPTLINSTYLVYQFHCRAAQAVDAVYDGGVALTASSDYGSYALLIAATITPGSYATCLAEGLIRVNAAVVFVLTADVQGDNTGGYVTTAGDILKRIALSFTGLVIGDIDTAAFTALNTANSSLCSLYVGTDSTPSAADLFTQIMVTVGGFWTFTPARLLTVKQIAFGTSAATISYQYGPLALDAVVRVETPPPYWRSKMGYATSWRVHAPNEIAGALTPAIAIDINYQTFSTTSNGKAFIHGLNVDSSRADSDGWYYYGAAQVTLPRAQFADGSTLKTSQTSDGYIVHDFDPVTVSFQDVFTGTAATDLSAHTPNTGTSWSDISGITRKFKLDGTGKVAVSLATTNVIVTYRANNAPSSANMFAEYQLDAWDETYPNNWGVIGRYQSATSMYVFNVSKALSAGLNLSAGIYLVTGVSTVTQVGNLAEIPYVAGMKLRLTCIGTTISAWAKNPGEVKWTLYCTGTDSGISAAGNGGIYSGAMINAGFQTAPAALLSNFRAGNATSAWTVSAEKPAVAFCRYSGGNWQYDTGAGWTNFTRTSSMLVIGAMTRGASSITSAAISQPQMLPATDAQTVIVRSAFIGEQQRFVTTSDTAVQTRHKLAREREVASLFDTSAAATTENARQFALLDAKWDLYQVPVLRTVIEDYSLTLGATVTLRLNRFGLTSGKDMIIGGMSTGADPDETVLTLWG
jgi:hypothetical protein